MKFPPHSFKQRAHALVHQLPDNATWRDLIDTAIERMDLDAEAERAYAATITALDLGDLASTELDRFFPPSSHGCKRLAIAEARSTESERRIRSSSHAQEHFERNDCAGVASETRSDPVSPQRGCPEPEASHRAITDYDA